jgi:hypothetical protein
VAAAAAWPAASWSIFNLVATAGSQLLAVAKLVSWCDHGFSDVNPRNSCFRSSLARFLVIRDYRSGDRVGSLTVPLSPGPSLLFAINDHSDIPKGVILGD